MKTTATKWEKELEEQYVILKDKDGMVQAIPDAIINILSNN